MTLDDVFRVTEEFGTAARNARASGMDGVELHCASGYLINQFLNPASNQRDDDLGGDAERRASFPAMVLGRLADEIGIGRVGFRISPGNPYNGMEPNAPEEIFPLLLRIADSFLDIHASGGARSGLAYCHVVDMGLEQLDTLAMIRANWNGPIITNNNLKADGAAALLDQGRADAASFGRAFIANPDLPARIRTGAPLAKPDYGHLYTGEARGYTDYPKL
jgi:N-ethylmaleimide reductase